MKNHLCEILRDSVDVCLEILKRFLLPQMFVELFRRAGGITYRVLESLTVVLVI